MKWSFFGSDPVARAKLTDRFGSSAEVCSPLSLSEIAEELRGAFIDSVGAQNYDEAELNWWVSAVSEKNPYVSDLFLNICRLRAATLAVSDIAPGKSELTHIVIFDDPVVARTFARELSLQGAEHKLHVTPPPFMVRLKTSKLGTIVRRVRLLQRMSKRSKLQQRRASSMFGKPNEPSTSRSQRVVHLLDWIDNRSFPAGGGYQGIALGEMYKKLSENGYEPVLVPYILPGIQLGAALTKLNEAKVNYLPPELFLKPRDVLTAILRWDLSRKPDFSEIKVGEHDVSELFRSAYIRDARTNRPIDALLFYYALQRMAEHGIKIRSLTYPYECHVWEKPVLMALRRYHPGAKAYGVQHSTFWPMLLNYYFSTRGAELVPLPDTVLTNGPVYQRALIEAGYPESSVKVNGAIRYKELFGPRRGKIETKERKPGSIVILLASSISRDKSVEFLNKCHELLASVKDCVVMLKCHPLMPFRSIEDALVHGLKDRLTVTDLPPGELLRNTDLLLYADTTVSLEALAAGVPVVQIRSELDINMDPLELLDESDEWRKVHASVRNREEFERSLAQFMGQSEEERQWCSQTCRRAFETLFAEPTDESYLRPALDLPS